MKFWVADERAINQRLIKSAGNAGAGAHQPQGNSKNKRKQQQNFVSYQQL